ncbi:FRG domain-containing protein [Paraglaciecola marina]|uniref:FRG domain-containing protein n=1 Tax=Paraglaciecola marina TaxID=2500157 RepID=UPI00105FBC0F|nr:FRG domain-containing protein [Paraglaciecola marina]
MGRERTRPVVRTIDVNSIAEYLDAIEKSRRDLSVYGNTSLWFRGHASNRWALQPSIYRDIPYYNGVNGSNWSLERTFLVKFQSGAYSRSENLPDQNDISQWLCLMRHYGVPTRLLDWSTCPLVAAYFALSSSNLKTPNIWILSPTTLNELHNTVAPILILRDGTPDKSLSNHLLNIKNDYNDETSVLAVDPPEVDSRLLAQKAKFTIHGSSNCLSRTNLGQSFLNRVRFTQQGVKEMTKALKLFSYNQSTIFPDLEHLALELRDKISMRF